MSERVEKTEQEWRQQLTPEQYHIVRGKGTERPFVGRLYRLKAKGVYRCVACDQELFESDAKYESGSGWPSFWAPIAEEKIETATDLSHGMVRTEIRCDRCGAHLGHLFEDGPRPTGLRYCVNSAALKFVDEQGQEIVG